MLTFTANQIVSHLIGDYILQSDWMADNKTKSLLVAFIHATFYALPFAFFTQPSFAAFLFIIVTHAYIDRFKLARYVVWFKNFIAHPTYPQPLLKMCPLGYSPEKPIYLTVWLFILADNTLHLLCNAFAIQYL